MIRQFWIYHMEFWGRPCRDNYEAFGTTDGQDEVSIITAWRGQNIHYRIVAPSSEPVHGNFKKMNTTFNLCSSLLKP